MSSTDKDNGEMRHEVLRRMEGFHERQTVRNSLRAMATRMKMIQSLRRNGLMNTLEDGRAALLKTGMAGSEESYYGITILHSTASVSLAYDREGRLSWTSHPKKDEVATQEAFDFSDELLASSAEDVDFLELLSEIR